MLINIANSNQGEVQSFVPASRERVLSLQVLKLNLHGGERRYSAFVQMAPELPNIIFYVWLLVKGL